MKEYKINFGTVLKIQGGSASVFIHQENHPHTDQKNYVCMHVNANNQDQRTLVPNSEGTLSPELIIGILGKLNLLQVLLAYYRGSLEENQTKELILPGLIRLFKSSQKKSELKISLRKI